MKLRLTTLALGAVMAAGPVMADLVFPSLSYRTGPYAAGGIPFADGYADYFTLLNQRDGGIGGVMTNVTAKIRLIRDSRVSSINSINPSNIRALLGKWR